MAKEGKETHGGLSAGRRDVRLSGPLARFTHHQIRAALELVRDAEPVPDEVVALVQNLGVYRYADVCVRLSRGPDRSVVTSIVAAELTPAGVDLLRRLDAAGVP